MKTYYKLDIKSKKLVEELITKVESEGCFDTTKLKKIKKQITFFNFPYKMNQVIKVLEDNKYPQDVGEVLWYKLPYTIDRFKSVVDNFSCTNIADNDAPTTPQGLVTSNITATSVKLDWNTSTDNREVASYNIYKDGSVTATRVGNTATISGLTTATTYSFKVSAVDTAGNESGFSTVEQVTTI
jgi:hypothetical protein